MAAGPRFRQWRATDGQRRVDTLRLRDRNRILRVMPESIGSGKPDAAVSIASDRPLRWPLTLLFVDVVGSSELAQRIEAEHLADVLETLRGVCRAVARDHGGQVARAQGDGVLLVFGIDDPGEDTPARAVDAALEIHARFESTSFPEVPAALTPIRLHSGVHAGLTLVAPGDIERGRIDLVGDAANTAARLAQLAAPGTVLADLDSLGPLAMLFDTERHPPMRLPGRPNAVRVATVSGRSNAVRAPGGTAWPAPLPLVGRRDLVAAVVAWVTGALDRRHPSRRAFLCGPPGIGKSRLLDEIAARPELAHVGCGLGHCERRSRGLALLPFESIVASWTDHNLVTVPAVDQPASGASRAEQLLALISARPGPVLLLIDDWQWADDASRQLLESALALDRPVAALLAMRVDAQSPGPWTGAVRFDVPPLTEAETATAVRHRLPLADPLSVSRLHRQAGGVPLYVEELCHGLAHSDEWALQGGKPGASNWLASLVVSRLFRLPPHLQRIVRAAAVLGNDFDVPTLAAVGGCAVDGDDIAALAQADFVYPKPAGRLRFKHGLTRDAVYDCVGLSERVGLHHAAVRALSDTALPIESAPRAEALAYHARAAGLWPLASTQAESAGDAAAAAFALDVARAHYLVALDALDRCGELQCDELLRWCSLAHKLALTCIFDVLALPDIEAILERALERAKLMADASAVARSHYWLAYIRYGLGSPRRAVEHAQSALAIARSVDDRRLAAQVQATLGQSLAAACEYRAALQLMDAAVAAKRTAVRTGSAVAVGSAFTLACKASVLADQGDFVGAHDALQSARELLGESTHPVANSVRNWAVMVLLWQGRWNEAEAVADESVALARSAATLMPLAIGRAAGGYARWISQHSLEGFGQIAEAVRWMERGRGRFFTSIYYGWLVEGHVTLGRHAQARLDAAKLLQRARAGERLGEAVGCRALALAFEGLGRRDAAARYIARAESSALRRQSRREQALNLQCRARLARMGGDEVRAVDLLHGAIAEFEAMAMAWHAQQARAML
jgi:class 3 adenylate cyclase/tetratricopeptide (TPR) repeat protein